MAHHCTTCTPEVDPSNPEQLGEFLFIAHREEAIVHLVEHYEAAGIAIHGRLEWQDLPEHFRIVWRGVARAMFERFKPEVA